ncbi:KHG/KDPG aldolase-like isoform X2 [Impatiens glandulifera]|uniref:KHG/KDPG aldolase-like isoform X2 n=1 Tax=Impatiens glandulifera TaxID=253017 RepID=UPI001FB16365|nr:KHG/KDPG aldolase-like isoform X2 [Impatiens glandulifera]
MQLGSLSPLLVVFKTVSFFQRKVTSFISIFFLYLLQTPSSLFFFFFSRRQNTFRHKEFGYNCLPSRGKLAIEAARAAISGGISVLEIVMSTPDVFEILQQLVQEYPTITFGVGTVLNDKDAKKALLSGAKFLMSPAIVKEIMSVVHAGEALYIPGVMTPTEILSAYNMGAKIVKVYPVSALGGVQYIAAIRKPFSHIPMVASQGVTIDLLGDYILQGASAVLLSDAIFSKEAMGRKDFNAIYRLAQLAVFEGKKALERKRNELP